MQTTSRHFDYIVLGAGPAGLQLGQLLKRNGRDFAILERASRPGAFFETFPRHRKLISINKVHTGYTDAEKNLRWDWNSLLSDDADLRLGAYSSAYFPPASAFLEYCAAYARKFELPIQYEQDIESIERSEQFTLTTRTGQQFTCRRLVVATGVAREHLPNVPGIELCETYATHDTDARRYTGRRVLIIGKGNSGFETADHLIETAAMIHIVSPRPLRMAWRTHFVGDLRACNNNLLDTYQLKLQNAVLDATIDRIEKDDDALAVTFRYAHAGGEIETLHYDHVISCAGFRFDAEPFRGAARPQLTPCGRFPAQTHEWESVNVPGLFFAGTLMQARDMKKYMSAFIHGFRYNVRALSRVLDERFHDQSWPRTERSGGTERMLGWILSRLDTVSSSWQQPGYLCDVIRLSPSDESFECFEEMSVDMAKARFVDRGDSALQLTLEFGSPHDDPFAAERIHRKDARRADQSRFLHPVLRHYARGALRHEHHVIEDLAAEWREPEHVEPLREFLEGIRDASSSTWSPPPASSMHVPT